MNSPSRTRLVLLTALMAAAIAGLASAQLPQPKAVVVEPVIDLGEVSRGETPTARFTIENQGDAPLTIKEISKSCACMEVKSTDIPPKGTGQIEITIDTLKLSGANVSNATFETNDPATPSLTLTVRVLSMDRLTADPGYYRYLVHQNFTGDGIIRQVVAATDNTDFEITKIEVPHSSLRVARAAEPAAEEERIANLTGSQWAFEIQLDNKAPVGPLSGNVEVHTTHASQKIIPIPLSGFVRPVVALTPGEISFGSFVPNGRDFLKLHMKQFAADPMTILEISSDLEGFTFEAVDVEPGRAWHIRAYPSVDLPKGPFRGTVTVKSSSQYQPTTTFPIRGTVQ